MDVRHAPSDLLVIGFAGETVPQSVRDHLDQALQSGVVRLLDLLAVTRDETGTVRLVERDDLDPRFGDLDVPEQGLVGEDDVMDAAEDLDPGQTALIVLLEHVWARELTAAVRHEGGELLAAHRIPAVVLDEVEDAAADD